MPPTESELDTQWTNAIAVLDNHLEQQTIPADILVYENSIDSDFSSAQGTGAARFRSQAAAGVGSPLDVLSPIVVAYNHHIVKKPERQVGAAFNRIYTFYQDNNKRLQSRGFIFGVPPVITGTGTGLVERLVVDENGHSLENQFPDTKSFRCTGDEQSNANRHEELFEFVAGPRSLDVLDVDGSGTIREITALSSNQTLLSNPTFSQFTWATPPTVGSPETGVAGDALTDWTLADVTLAQLDIDLVVKDAVGDSVPTSVRFLGNNTLTQLFSAAPLDLNPNAPHRPGVWVFRESNADGTITLTNGSVTQAFTVTSLSNAAWNWVTFDLDKDLWLANFNINDPTFKIAWAGRTTGTIVLDEVGYWEMIPLDGAWYVISGGVTKFLLDDESAFADTVPVESKFQKWNWRGFGRYLPAALTAPTTAATAALAGAGAGNVEDGTHSWKITFVDAQAVESAGSAKSNVLTVVDKSTDGQVSLTSIPTGAANVVSRKIYRTVAGDAGNHLLVGTIADNVTTIFTDNVADGSLGAASPTGITVFDPA